MDGERREKMENIGENFWEKILSERENGTSVPPIIPLIYFYSFYFIPSYSYFLIFSATTLLINIGVKCARRVKEQYRTVGIDTLYPEERGYILEERNSREFQIAIFARQSEMQ